MRFLFSTALTITIFAATSLGAAAQIANGPVPSGSGGTQDRAAPLAPAPVTGPISGGKHLQPQGVPTQGGISDADRLLQEGQHSPAAHEPPVVPRDLYGQPMGGDPGMTPPDPNPHRETAPASP